MPASFSIAAMCAWYFVRISRHARRGVEVVVAVGHAEAALQQEGRVARRVVEVLRDPQAEQVVGVRVGGVEHVDVGAQRAAERARERAGGVGDRGDALERGLEAARAPSPRSPASSMKLA